MGCREVAPRKDSLPVESKIYKETVEVQQQALWRESTVRVDVQSWFEQRMKTAMSGGAGSGEAPSLRERRPQPYR